MEVHNILEEIVIKEVNTLYDKVKNMNTSWLSCDCEQCRTDTASYVLNRIQPCYVVSGRGLTHTIQEENNQKMADIQALTIEGMRRVASTKRSYHGYHKTEMIAKIKGSAFNFPAFVGTVMNGRSFEPLADVKITLKSENKLVEMMDYTWQNPLITSKATDGSFAFWIKSIPANQIGEQRIFTFSVEASAKNFETAFCNFSVPLMSSEKVDEILDSTYSIKIQDICLFPTEKQA